MRCEKCEQVIKTREGLVFYRIEEDAMIALSGCDKHLKIALHRLKSQPALIAALKVLIDHVENLEEEWPC
jgi:hypothetical protein